MPAFYEDFSSSFVAPADPYLTYREPIYHADSNSQSETGLSTKFATVVVGMLSKRQTPTDYGSFRL